MCFGVGLEEASIYCIYALNYCARLSIVRYIAFINFDLALNTKTRADESPTDTLNSRRRYQYRKRHSIRSTGSSTPLNSTQKLNLYVDVLCLLKKEDFVWLVELIKNKS
jgi:hypothetical protein